MSQNLPCISLKTALKAALVSLAMLPMLVNAAIIDKALTINVYQVCDTDFTNCAADGTSAGDQYFAAATNKIWAQAGISVDYTFKGQINNTAWNNDGNNNFSAITAYGGHYLSTTVVDMFLIQNYPGAYGAGWLGKGGLVMDMPAILGYAAGGRIDTMAHELGHNFGLVSIGDPESNGTSHSTNPNELMAPGNSRNVPLTLANIYPAGLGYDQLSAYQIALARQSTLLHNISAVPEAESYAMMLSGLALIGALSKRRRQSR
jgi:Metallo-peptidase family M12B Reprolysin-like